MKKLLFILLALIALFAIIFFLMNRPPKLVMEENTATTSSLTDSPVVTPGSKQVTLSLREKINFNDIIIEPFAISEDSRCPSDVQCIQAGRVVIALNIYSLENEHILTKELIEGNSFNAGSTRITLEKVEPYPVSTKKFSNGDYKFNFLLEVLE